MTRIAQEMTDVLSNPSTQLVFITTSHDTRFDSSGLIRPLMGEES